MIPRKQQIVFSFMLAEFILMNGCLLGVLFFKLPEIIYSNITLQSDFLYLLLISNISFLFISVFNSDPNYYTSYTFRRRLQYLLTNVLLFIGATSTLAVLFKIDYLNRTMVLLPIGLYAIINLFLFRFAVEFYLHKNRDAFNSKILFIGNGHNWKEIFDFTERIRPLGYTSIGYLYHGMRKAQSSQYESSLNVLGDLNKLPNVLSNHQIDEIFMTDDYLHKKEMDNIVNLADYNGIRINVIPEQAIRAQALYASQELNGMPFFKHRSSPLDLFNNFLIKRIFDFCFSFIVLVLLAPIFLLIALLIKIDSRGPVLYRPWRKGESGKNFRCVKFRTMSVCEDPMHGAQSTVKNDPRITRVGKYLRKLDLDELPQFYNVLKGEMSVVGPRPHRVNLSEDFRRSVNDYMVRHYVKPGITGWAQVNGWRGPTQTQEQKTQRIKHDLHYIESWSFWQDVKIIFLTVFGRKTRHNAF